MREADGTVSELLALLGPQHLVYANAPVSLTVPTVPGG